MSKIVNFERREFASAEIVINVQVLVRPTRIEECHGFHYFNDDEELSRSLESVKIILDDFEIDITERLTKEEIDKIKDAQL